VVRQHDGIEQAMALLQGYGVRRIAYLAGRPHSLANVERQRMICRIMAERGMEPPTIMAGDYGYDAAYRATLDLFRVGDGADAIFAANDVSAFGAIDALRHDLGLSVPGDVKVIGFDDIPQAHWKSYNLTTVRIDLEDRVRALVRLILRRLKTPDSAPLVETLRTRLVVRGTVG
jgi:DNA-binding LacI/PurR family transcriptional regulator